MNRQALIRELLVLLLLGSNVLAQNDLWSHDSLRYKIGQMLIFGFQGNVASNLVLDEIGDYNVGGVLLYRVHDNIQNADQATALVQSLQNEARLPLIIATDQEGGTVTNLRASNGFQNSPSAYELGQQNDEVITRNVAAMFSGWFESLGINTDLAPVVDLRLNPGNVIGDRSYSADPQVVSQNAYWFMDEFHANGQLTALKHFPGHGSSQGDSHLGFTDVTNTWQSTELDPYIALFDSGCVDIVMTAHVFNAALDSLYPSTLSASTIDGLLRDTLGFEGVVMSDAMMMGAITANYGLTEAVTLAINAGVDILLYNWDDDMQGHRLVPLLVDHIADRVLDLSIPRSRIETSYGRITTLKQRIITDPMGLSHQGQPDEKQLLWNFPNPFNPSTTIRYELPEAAHVLLLIYDVRGRLVHTLVSGQQSAGWYDIIWKGESTEGKTISTGIYYASLDADGDHQLIKMLYLK